MIAQYTAWTDTTRGSEKSKVWRGVWVGVVWVASQRRKDSNRPWTEFGWAGQQARGYSVRNLGEEEVLLFGGQWQSKRGWGQTWKEGNSKPGKLKLESACERSMSLKIGTSLQFIFSILDTIYSFTKHLWSARRSPKELIMKQWLRCSEPLLPWSLRCRRGR